MARTSISSYEEAPAVNRFDSSPIEHVKLDVRLGPRWRGHDKPTSDETGCRRFAEGRGENWTVGTRSIITALHMTSHHTRRHRHRRDSSAGAAAVAAASFAACSCRLSRKRSLSRSTPDLMVCRSRTCESWLYRTAPIATSVVSPKVAAAPPLGRMLLIVVVVVVVLLLPAMDFSWFPCSHAAPVQEVSRVRLCCRYGGSSVRVPLAKPSSFQHFSPTQ
jgi:hypothetical protein